MAASRSMGVSSVVGGLRRSLWVRCALFDGEVSRNRNWETSIMPEWVPTGHI